MKHVLTVSVFALAIGFASVAPAQLFDLFSRHKPKTDPAPVEAAVPETAVPKAAAHTAAAAPAHAKLQTTRLAIEVADKSSQADRGLKIEKQFTGRLPRGYGEVVDDTQRENIYKIQQQYFEEIELLKQRLDLLEAERNMNVDAMLTADQQAKLKDSLGELESTRSVRRANERHAGKDVEEEERTEYHRRGSTPVPTTRVETTPAATTTPGTAATHTGPQRDEHGRFISAKDAAEKEEVVKEAKSHRTRARRHATEAKAAAAEVDSDAETKQAAAEAEASANEAAKEVEAAEEAATPAEARTHASRAKKSADDAETHSTKAKRHYHRKKAA